MKTNEKSLTMNVSEQTLYFRYKNWKGKESTRVATPISIYFGTTEWHPKPTWLMKAFDHDKEAERDFELVSMSQMIAAPGT